MRIFLDYYRILTVPIQASKEQIDRAYEDRVRQKPRREYSSIALEARKDLLQKAYEILSDDTQRTEYDENFLTTVRDDNNSESNAAETVVATLHSTIEIPPHLLVGALIVIHELAEYEQVIRLGQDYLNKDACLTDSNQGKDTVSEEMDTRKDIVLSMALSYLDLGKEKWRIQEYENAASSTEAGLNLLKQERVFFMLQEELETNLYKLRPYRILSLLANSSENSSQRATGLRLLQEILDRRQGIEGKGEDYSGLKFDKFLGFIQQVRNYLTTQEQIDLFVAEAKRPSQVATYLGMYALLAKGYGTKQPQLISQAQKMLELLKAGKEEVYWEQAICALLLGQAKQAHYAIERSGEKETIELIKQYSQNSPDLLPGLCVYGEKWLSQEVLSQFQDLSHCHITLQEYFADSNVQSYLEKLSPLKNKAQNQTPIQEPLAVSSQKNTFTNWFSRDKKVNKQVARSTNARNPEVRSNSRNTATATLERNSASTPSHTTSNTIVTEHFVSGTKQIPKKPKASQKKKSLTRKKSQSHNNLIKGGLLSLGLILGLGTLGFVFASNIMQNASNSKFNPVIAEKPSSPVIEEPEEPVVTNPPVITVALPEKPKIFDETIAKKTIEKWLDSKSLALGNEHNIEQLKQILAPSQLPKWQSIALQDKNNNIYRQYQHSVDILDLEFQEEKPNLAIVKAKVQEQTQYFQQGKSTSFKSSNDDLVVVYELVRQGDNWLINNSQLSN